MGPVPTWQFTKEGIAYYLGCPYTTSGTELTEAKNKAWNHLKCLLQSNAGSVAAILLTFTLFSVLKPFFPQLHRLDRSTPYLKAKKYFPEQFAVCVSCMDLDKAAKLAELCCSIVPKLPPRFPIVDGVKIFHVTEKMRRKDISMSEFEAKILQKAGVLWVGRKPSVEVSAQKLCLSLTIPASAEFSADPFLQPLLAYFTTKLHDISINSWKSMQKTVFEKSTQAVELLVRDLMATADKYAFSFSGDNPEEWYQDSKRSETFHLDLLETRVLRDVEKYRKEIRKCGSDRFTQVDRLEGEFRDHFKKVYKDIRTIQREVSREKQTLQIFYEEVAKDVKKYDLDLQSQQKIAYLLTSYQCFLKLCAPKEERRPMLAQLERALLREWQQFQPEFPVRAVLETYLTKLITEKRCARLRGKGSDRETVCLWYDPREQMFLLKNSYFPELEKLFTEDQKLTKRNWELLMEKAGVIETVQRKEQIRRSFEVQTGKGKTKRTSVLKIRAKILSPKFFDRKDVQIALRQMRRDETPYRAS